MWRKLTPKGHLCDSSVSQWVMPRISKSEWERGCCNSTGGIIVCSGMLETTQVGAKLSFFFLQCLCKKHVWDTWTSWGHSPSPLPWQAVLANSSPCGWCNNHKVVTSFSYMCRNQNEAKEHQLHSRAATCVTSRTGNSKDQILSQCSHFFGILQGATR